MVLGVLIAVGEMLSPGQYVNAQFTWLHLAGVPGPFPNGISLVVGTLVDPLSSLMLLVVTVVGFLVLLYSIGYMHHDHGLPRYYAELSLFLAAMTGLVLSNNLLEFFLFWELVGVCSYFLIGFYYEKPSAASAAKEAFLVTRVGDVLFLLGIFIYFFHFATTGPNGGWAANGFVFTNGTTPFLPVVSGGGSPLLTIAGLMILGGAAGKSAQFPLHVWLPDAMEGPTTVSALIHAATMVAAGVYLLAITSVFIGFTANDQLAIVAIGGFTAFFAATMAVVHPDIKRVIAYSTISQLGYMVLAVGAGFAMVGLYHLFTHAFFKALLFLAAGSVIHAVGTQDLFKMGGLKKPMRVTAIAFAIGGTLPLGNPAVLRVLEQGRHPRGGLFPARGAPALLAVLPPRVRGRVPDGLLHLPGLVPRVLGRPRPRPDASRTPTRGRGRCRSPSWSSPASRSPRGCSSSSPTSNPSSSTERAPTGSRRSTGRPTSCSRAPSVGLGACGIGLAYVPLGERARLRARGLEPGPVGPAASPEPVLHEGRIRLDRHQARLRDRAGGGLRRPVRHRRDRPGARARLLRPVRTGSAGSSRASSPTTPRTSSPASSGCSSSS